jgi:RHS repeat-associated protein
MHFYSQAGKLLAWENPATPTTITKSRNYHIYLGEKRIARKQSDNLAYVHTDHLGSLLALTTVAPAGLISANPIWEPWGAPVGGAALGGIQYADHYRDGATGLSYMQQRYYDPYAARFLAVDPVAASPGSFNRYWYANNNPYKFVDPDGRYAEAFAEAASLAIGTKSAHDNFRSGNYGAATVDVVGVIADVVLAALPVAPGVVGIVIQGARQSDTAVAVVRAARPADGSIMSSDDALDAASSFLGDGYKQVDSGVFRSADGTAQVRMTDSDLAKTNNHAGAPHMNFEEGRTVIKSNGKESFIPNKDGNSHVYLKDEK